MSAISTQLAKIYKRIPKMEHCEGVCWQSCGPIHFGAVEHDRMLRAAKRCGRQLGLHENGMCSLLTIDGRCSIYQDRPAICRIWGTTPKLRCPAGCVPEWWLEDHEASQIIDEITALSGGHNYSTSSFHGDEALTRFAQLTYRTRNNG